MPSNREYTAAEMCEAIHKSGGVVVRAANEIGCDPSTVYRYAEEYKTVQRALRDARLTLAAQAEGYHIRMVNDPSHTDHYKAVMDVLRNYHPDDWSDKRTEQEHSGDFSIEIVPPE